MTDWTKTHDRPKPRRAVIGPTYGEVLRQGFNRRRVLAGFTGSAGAAARGPGVSSPNRTQSGSIGFLYMAGVRDGADRLPEGYNRQILARRRHLLFPAHRPSIRRT